MSSGPWCPAASSPFAISLRLRIIRRPLATYPGGDICGASLSPRQGKSNRRRPDKRFAVATDPPPTEPSRGSSDRNTATPYRTGMGLLSLLARERGSKTLPAVCRDTGPAWFSVQATHSERKNPSSQQFHFRAAIHGALQGLQSADLALCLAVAPGERECVRHGVQIALQHSGEVVSQVVV
jgi:hypothetical protein